MGQGVVAGGRCGIRSCCRMLMWNKELLQDVDVG